MDGANPTASVIQASDGNFYGTASSGGAFGLYGTIFKITPSGVLTTLHSFDEIDGADPDGALVQATDGNLYGTTFGGGSSGDGSVFKVTLQGALRTLHTFCSRLCTDGVGPRGALIQAADGNFYGTAGGGGANNRGAVFKITAAGALTVLYSFCSQSGCTDGWDPFAGLVQGADGNFYGTTPLGGANKGDGTVFKITPGGALTTLYSFCSQTGCKDGVFPTAGLIQATDGNFYGTTSGGGTGDSICPSGCGTVFSITPDGALTTLHDFDGTDGGSPNALVQDTDGSFYGTTFEGGSSIACKGGCGTVFSLSVGLGAFVETNPNFGTVGRSVIVLGTNLGDATSVTFNGTPATFTIKSPTLITATVPAGASTGPIQVVTPSGTLTSNVNFRVEP